MADSDYLRQRSLEYRRIEGLYRNILIIGRSNHVRSVFRVALGHSAVIRDVRATPVGLERGLAKSPDVVCMDDPLASLEAIVETVKLLRRVNYIGPVLLMTDTDAKALQGALKGLNGIGVLVRDELNSVALLDALLHLTS